MDNDRDLTEAMELFDLLTDEERKCFLSRLREIYEREQRAKESA